VSANDIERVLEYWLGGCGADGALDPDRRKIWFGGGDRHDAEIRERFGALHDAAARGRLVGLGATPRGRLALIIVLDQFSRHIHRGTPAAFAQDPAAQALALEGLSLGADRELIPAARTFFYLPLEHAEDAVLQQLSVEHFERLAAAVAPAWREDYASFLDYARRHRDVIERFGRFPHRNAVLGRASSPQEAAFLREPGSSF
jgi:uncharacterized protein (DUF924 family)